MPLDEAAVDCVVQALAGGRVAMPPIMSMAIAESNGAVDVKTAHITGAVIWARDVTRAERAADDLPHELGIEVSAQAEAAQAMKGARVMSIFPSRI